MTPQEKADELLEWLDIDSALYTVNEVLIVLEDYSDTNEEDWIQVRTILINERNNQIHKKNEI